MSTKEDRQRKLEEKKAKADEAMKAAFEQDEPVKRGVGRPKLSSSKRSRIDSGELIKLCVTVDSDIHKQLATMAFFDDERDMSDIVNELLNKHLPKE